MSCGCVPGNDKCERDGCKFCCYCGELLCKPGSERFAQPYQVRHVDPPQAPMCPRSDTGHEPLEFPSPKFPRQEGDWIFATPHPPPTRAIVSGLIHVQLCKLCGLAYWEPLPPKPEPGVFHERPDDRDA